MGPGMKTIIYFAIGVIGYTQSLDVDLFPLPENYEETIYKNELLLNWDEQREVDNSFNNKKSVYVPDDPKGTLKKLCDKYDLNMGEQIIECDEVKFVEKASEHQIKKRKTEDIIPEEGSGDIDNEENVPKEQDPLLKADKEGAPVAEENADGSKLVLKTTTTISKVNSKPAEPEKATTKEENTKPHIITAATNSPTIGKIDEHVSIQPIAEQASIQPLDEQASIQPNPEHASIQPIPIQASIQPIPIQASIQPIPIQASIQPIPIQASIQPIPEQTSVHPNPEHASIQPTHPNPEHTSVRPAPEAFSTTQVVAVEEKKTDSPSLGIAAATSSKSALPPVIAAIVPNKNGKDENAKEVATNKADAIEKRPRIYSDIEHLDKEQSGLAALNADIKTLEESEKAVGNMRPIESLQMSPDEPKSGQSTAETASARSDSKILIFLGAAVLSVGVAAFTYNYVKKRRQSQGDAGNHQNGVTFSNEDPEAGREMKPLMKDGEQATETVESKVEIVDK